jgi:hypothetical protein
MAANAQLLQVPLAEIRDGAEIRRIEPSDTHEIDPLAAASAIRREE